MKYVQNWTRVCRLDSDRDGKTNGHELGDPNCTWKPGMRPVRSQGVSHPGMCISQLYRFIGGFTGRDKGDLLPPYVLKR